MLKLRKNKKGFTLVELIVVIAIMAVLAGTIAGVTVSQLNKQTNNTAKTEAQTLASDLHSFMIDYKLSAPDEKNADEKDKWKAGDKIDSILKLTHAVKDFIAENNQDGKIMAVGLGLPTGEDTAETAITAPEDNATLEAAIKDITGIDKNLKAGEHKFYAVVYKIEVEVKDGEGTKKQDVYKVRFCCLQKGNGKNQFPFADYTYSDVLADN